MKFDSKYNYPYTFTILVGNKEWGEAGEGNYQVRIFVTDLDASLSMLNASEELNSISLAQSDLDYLPSEYLDKDSRPVTKEMAVFGFKLILVLYSAVW